MCPEYDPFDDDSCEDDDFDFGIFGIDPFDDDELFDQPSEADAIIQKAQADLEAVFRQAIKDTIEKGKQAHSTLEDLQDEIAGAESELRRIKGELAAAKEKMEHIDKREMPKRYIDAFVRETTGFYAPGDLVWIVSSRCKKRTCPLCMGAKKVRVVGESVEDLIKCPRCNGSGSLTANEYFAKQEEIGTVRLTLCFDKNRVREWSSECVYLKGHEYHVDIKWIYKTEQEAQAQADAKNKEVDNECQK